MKKTYLQPTMMVVKLQQHGIICTSDVRSVNGNADLDYGLADKQQLNNSCNSCNSWLKQKRGLCHSF